MRYPDAPRGNAVSDLHGRELPDPYRWLEDQSSAATRAWIQAENELSAEYLAGLPERAWFGEQLDQLVSRPRSGTPYRKGGRYFVSRNDGDQAQDVWCWAPDLGKLADGGRILVDPNRLDETGGTHVVTTAVSDDGRYFAYALSSAGSDWMTIRVRDLDAKRDLDDELTRSRFGTIAWLPDAESFVYLHFPAGASGTEGQPAGELKVHRVGTPQASDRSIIDSAGDSTLIIHAEVSYDHRWLIVEIHEGTSTGNRLWAFPLATGAHGTRVGEAVRIFDDNDARYDSVRVIGEEMLVRTNAGAPRYRLVRVRIADEAADLVDVIPEHDGVLESVTSAGGALVTVHLEDALPVLHRYQLDGSAPVPIPMAGSRVLALEGSTDDPELFVGVCSATQPSRSYRVDLGTGDILKLPVARRAQTGKRRASWQPPVVTMRRETARSADGTTIPYFLIHREDLSLDAPAPTILHGYGGFGVVLLPDFRPGWPAWLAAGGVLAIANLRGGGEYGEAWHEAGRLHNKQKVFDDFVAVAEHLIHEGVTTSRQLALHGRSNGGLLVGAVLTQRPDLAAVALPMVGMFDMVRFERFTVGATLTSELGSPSDPQMASTLLRYSPLHNVRDGEHYPATLISTGDCDDRIVPAHSYKMAAALQHAQAGDAPILARIETRTGHGHGKPRAKLAAEWADLMAFAAHHTGLRPPG